jgi:hypothetical protein
MGNEPVMENATILNCNGLFRLVLIEFDRYALKTSWKIDREGHVVWSSEQEIVECDTT